MIIELSPDDFDAFLGRLRQRDDRLEFGEPANKDEAVNDYVFSGHAEALRSDSIDGEVMETLADLELEADGEDEAWEKIKTWYLTRGCVVLRVEDDEYVLAENLAERLGLLGESS
ncbi:hypothetical protein [Deinococcus yavapaiensis]|uniref:Uncharacterized protein n=1 Tax=Deinococcus yavapaiensis KR-236 TaxID=694435 RepID=A0A318SST3_9DEIO|nr:hypothetical protein [Deinococcus yavapaiensis]PYE56266.1 hypothetical protein DES52_10170 [Deinococcus yavapaiensis KR-236]